MLYCPSLKSDRFLNSCFLSSCPTWIFQQCHIFYHQFPFAVTGNCFQPGWCSKVFEATVKAHDLKNIYRFVARVARLVFCCFLWWRNSCFLYESRYQKTRTPYLWREVQAWVSQAETQRQKQLKKKVLNFSLAPSCNVCKLSWRDQHNKRCHFVLRSYIPKQKVIHFCCYVFMILCSMCWSHQTWGQQPLKPVD